MDSLVKLATWALIEYGKASRAAIMRAALCAGLAGALMIAALGCTATALWLFSLPALGPFGAPLIVAAALTILATVLALAAWLFLHKKEHRSTAATPQML